MTNTTPSVRPRAQQQRRRASVSLAVLARFPDVSERGRYDPLDSTSVSIIDDVVDAELHPAVEAIDAAAANQPVNRDGTVNEPAGRAVVPQRKLQPQYILAVVFLVFVAILAFMMLRRSDSPSAPVRPGWSTETSVAPVGPSGPSEGIRGETNHQIDPPHTSPGTPDVPGNFGETPSPPNHSLPYSPPADSGPLLHDSHGAGAPGVARLNGTIGKTYLRSN